MKIGQFVRRHIAAIFEFCETVDPAEFPRLQDRDYSKAAFDINYPFCKPVGAIDAIEHRRYWSTEYLVAGTSMRVANHWFNPPTSNSLAQFRQYITERGIGAGEDMPVES